MGPSSQLRKMDWDDNDVEVLHLSAPTTANLHPTVATLSPTNAHLQPVRVVSSSKVSGPMVVRARAPHLPSLNNIHPEPVTVRRLSNPAMMMKRVATGIHSVLPTVQTKSKYLQALFAAVVCVCLLWTLWLMLLNAAPNYTVNRIMNTEHFDNGSFWLFVDPPASIFWMTEACLSVVGIGYIVILAKMIMRPRHVVQAPPSPRSSSKLDSSKVASFAAKVVEKVANVDTSSKQRAKLWLKVGDLAFETLLLVQVLEYGSPKVIVAIFTLVVASNALGCALLMFLPFKRMGLLETLVDLMFDMLIAVGCPMLILLYCLSTFNFPRAKLAINFEVFPTGWFEQQASVLADPVQTAVIYKSLKSLRVTSILELFARMGVHSTLFLRLRQLVILIQEPGKQKLRAYPARHRGAASVFVIFAILLLVFVGQSLRTSAIACKPHPECVVNAHRWTFVTSGSLTQCPCIMLIDRDIAPKTYAEWEQPKNLTDKVAQLAARGDLQTLQLTNRYLPVLPDELKRCTEMRHLSLEYTHTQTLPEWINTYTKLEFLHIESKFTSPVVALPDDMFDAMSALTFIHLAGFIPMKRLPSLRGLTNLKSLTLAVFLMLEELPDFDSLHNLERLLITCIPSLNTLPDFSPIQNVKSLILTDRGAWCCNGFISKCNLKDPMCQVHPLWGTPAATCLDPQTAATPATLELIAKFPASVCTGLLYPGSLEGPPTPTIMDPCNGTLYRQCEDPSGVEAMCYNARFMGIACDTNPFPIAMRRRQIELGVGDPCDPAYEAWLGCH